MTEKIGPHRRSGWTPNEPDLVYIAANYGILKDGGGRLDRGASQRRKEQYYQAKRNRDSVAAFRVVDDHCGDDWYETIVAQVLPSLEAGKRLIFVWPMPGFAAAVSEGPPQPITNALPAAVAQRLVEVIGGELNSEVLQIARPGRTKLEKMARFLFQPTFGGEVDTNAHYVLVDDNYTTGGTLAALRSHIVENGGTVVALCALCGPNGPGRRAFRLAKSSLDVLLSIYERELIPFWLKEVGHALESLTDDEGQALISWGRQCPSGESPLHRLGACFDKIRSTGHE
jgi:hypothetical protein